MAGLDWYRGSARIEHGDVVLAAATFYRPSTTREVLYDLVALRTEADILIFVRDHGLLTRGDRAPLDAWWTERDQLAAALAMVQPTLVADATVLADRVEFGGRVWPFGPREDLAARVVTDGLAEHVRYQVVVPSDLPFDTLPPGVRYGGLWVPTDLLGCAYIELMAVMLEGSPNVRPCAGCGRPFLPRDVRQRFHSRACGSSARQRTFHARRRAGVGLDAGR